MADHIQKEKSPPLLLPATLIYGKQSLSMSALIDSGCEQNLIVSTLVQQLSIDTIPLSVPLHVTTIDGQTHPQITHQTKPLHLVTSGNHRELISFFVFSTASSAIILGFSWLQQHNPHINWSNNLIESWSISCHHSCLGSAVSPSPPLADSKQESALISQFGSRF